MSNLWPDGGGGGFGRDGGPGGGLVAARKGRSPGQGDQGFLRRNFQKGAQRDRQPEFALGGICSPIS